MLNRVTKHKVNGTAQRDTMKTIALVAHDKLKMRMVTWCKEHVDELKYHRLVGTRGTAKIITERTSLNIHRMGHGPDGGDIEIASHIAVGMIDVLIFFRDVDVMHPHESDIQHLIRACISNNIPFALNKSTASLLIGEVSRLGNAEIYDNCATFG